MQPYVDQQWVRIGDSDSSPLAARIRTGMVVGRIVDRGGERQYGAEGHGWTEISRHATQDETAAAASWRLSQ
jgi:hypothetical protein